MPPTFLGTPKETDHACRLFLLSSFAFVVTALAARADDPLPSWHDTPTKKAITAFVERVTKEGYPDFIPVADRIATFDNDGTLWSEQPLYFIFSSPSR